MRRRFALAAALAGAALAQPSRAQQPSRVYRLGILLGGAPPTAPVASVPPWIFLTELERHGFVEGRNLVIDRRWTERDFTKLDAAAAELVALTPDVIFTVSGTAGARAAQRATRTIPIVFEAVGNPVAAGLVASLPRPGGNLTGMTIFTNTLDPKRAQILVEALGKPTLLAVLDIRRNDEQRRRAMAGWPEFPGTRVQVFEFERPEELPAVFERIAQQKASGLVVMHSPFTGVNHPLIAQLATKHRLPAIAHGRPYAEAGLMLTYSTDFHEALVRAADYVARILKGTATPAELPVEHLSRFPFVINLRVAREFGMRIPRALLARADEVID